MQQLKDSEKKDKKVLVKMSHDEFETAKEMAGRFTQGNVSKWIRYSLKQEPKKEDLIKNGNRKNKN